jgi:hypothetical protein
MAMNTLEGDAMPKALRTHSGRWLANHSSAPCTSPTASDVVVGLGGERGVAVGVEDEAGAVEVVGDGDGAGEGSVEADGALEVGREARAALADLEGR